MSSERKDSFIEKTLPFMNVSRSEYFCESGGADFELNGKPLLNRGTFLTEIGPKRPEIAKSLKLPKVTISERKGLLRDRPGREFPECKKPSER